MFEIIGISFLFLFFISLITLIAWATYIILKALISGDWVWGDDDIEPDMWDGTDGY